MYKFKFADIGEGLHEGRVAEVYKSVGDIVKEGDSLISVETDKVTTDIPAPVDGKIVKVLVEVGQTIHVGEIIFHIDDGSGEDSEEEEKPQKEVKSADSEGESAGVVGEVKVSNELLDFSSLAAPSRRKKGLEGSSRRASRRAERLARDSEKEQTEEVKEDKQAEQKDEGRPFKGAVEREFDLIVVGGGPGGYLAAELGAKEGLSTLIVEKEFFGGVCLNVGCIPTKTLLKSVELLKEVKEGKDFGVNAKVNKFDVVAAHEQKRKVVEKLTGGISMLLGSAGVTKIVGEASFVGSDTVAVDGKNYRAKNIILATGSLDKQINIEGFEEGYKKGNIFTSREALLSEVNLPEEIVIIGGGVIGSEFAQIYSGFGHKVTIIHATDQILPNLDSEAVKEVSRSLEESGVRIIYSCLPNSYNQKKAKLTVKLADGSTEIMNAKKILTAIGRYPVNAQVDKVGVKLDARGAVIVDDNCQSNVKGFYAIGDCNGKDMLAHAAYRQAVVAINKIVGREDSYGQDPVPVAVYTIPELASVGKSEAQAKSEGLDFLSAKFTYAHLGRGISSAKERGFCKLVFSKEDGRLFGATIVGAVASDLISQIAQAIVSEATVFELARTIHPHPSFAEIL